MQPRHPAILGPAADACLSYAALKDAIWAAGQKLGQMGVRPGNCVGLHCPSGTDYIIWTYAVWKCGACAVPIPMELADPEKQQILDTIAVDFVVTKQQSSAFVRSLHDASRAALDPQTMLVPVSPARDHPGGFATINSAFIRFTSGTTAAAKGVVLSHETIYERIQAVNEVLQLGPQDRIIWTLSMAYHFAVTVVGYLTFGSTLILVPTNFAEATLAAARRHRATLIYGAPAQYGWLARCPSAGPLPDLRLAISTTAALDCHIAQEFHQRIGLPVTQALGIIEVGLPFINLDFALDRPDGVGRILPAYRYRLQDVALATGLQEILLAGPGFLDAYYDPWQPRQAILSEGWLRTGDIGDADRDGCLFIRGRLKDVINFLGLKVFPQEVEAVLLCHPGVESAAVYGRRDPRFGEVPEACLVLRAGQPVSKPELMQFCSQRLAAFKIPQRIQFVPALPQTANGKTLHRDRHEHR